MGEDQLVGELAALQRSLAAPVDVDVGDLPNLYRLLGVLLAQGEPPLCRIKTRHPLPERPSVANMCATHENLRPATFSKHALFPVRAGKASAGRCRDRHCVGQRRSRQRRRASTSVSTPMERREYSWWPSVRGARGEPMAGQHDISGGSRSLGTRDVLAFAWGRNPGCLRVA